MNMVGKKQVNCEVRAISCIQDVYFVLNLHKSPRNKNKLELLSFKKLKIQYEMIEKSLQKIPFLTLQY